MLGHWRNRCKKGIKKGNAVEKKTGRGPGKAGRTARPGCKSDPGGSDDQKVGLRHPTWLEQGSP